MAILRHSSNQFTGHLYNNTLTLSVFLSVCPAIFSAAESRPLLKLGGCNFDRARASLYLLGDPYDQRSSRGQIA